MHRGYRYGGVLLASAIIAGTVGSSAALAKKTLRFWVPAEYTWQTMAKKFEKANPGVSIQVVSGEMDKFYTMITAGLMPDIWGPWQTPGITADVNRNWALDLTPYITRDSKSMNLNDFFPGLMRQFKVKGRQYSLPIFYYCDWYFYDKDKYAQAGLMPPPADPKDRSWTWEKMVENAQKVTKYDTRGNVTQPGLEFDRGFSSWARMWGASLYSPEALKSSIPQEINLDTPEMITALTKAWELIYKYKTTKAAVTSFPYNPKQVGSSIEAGWNVKFVFTNAKAMKWALAPLPYGKTNAGTTWPDGWRISRITKDKELAWKFVKFMCEPENMKQIISDPKSNYKGSGVARKSVFEDTMAQDIAKATGMNPSDVLKIYEGADDVGIVKEQETICLNEDLFRTYLNTTYVDLFSNKMTPRQAAAKLQAQANKGLPTLFQRWVRNVRFSGSDKTK